MSALLCELVLIKRTGLDGAHYPVYVDSKGCVFGRHQDCDVRIQINNVSLRHATLYPGQGNQPWISNHSQSTKTLVNDVPVEEARRLYSGDIIKISDRSFRCELPGNEQLLDKQSSPLVETQNVGVVTAEKVETPTKGEAISSKKRVTKSPRSVGNENQRRQSKSLESSSNKTTPGVQPGNFPGSVSPRPIRARRRSSLVVGQPSFTTPRLLSGEKFRCDQQQLLSPVEEENQSNHEVQTVFSDAPQLLSTGTPGHRRSVRFGPLLSPEEFDKRLPPNTPVKVGRTPTGRRRSSPGVVIQPSNCQLKRLSLAGILPNKEMNVKEDTQQHAILHDGSDMNSDSGKEIQLRKMATPVRCEIEKGVQLKITKRHMGTPMKQAIKQGIELNQLKKKMQTPLRRQIQQGTQLKSRRKHMATPLRSAIEREVELKQLRKKMATPVRNQIKSGVQLRQLKKKMATPIRSEIEKGVQLKTSKRCMATPMKQEIKQGIELKRLKRKMQTPLRRQIQQGTELKAARKHMATPLRSAIEKGLELKQLRKKMATPVQYQIKSGIQLRQLKKKMATPIRSEIEKGVQLKTSKRRMATPMKQEIKQGIELKQLKRKMQTPLRRQIQQGTELKATRKHMATPLRSAIEKGVELKQLRKRMATPIRKQIESGIQLRQLRKKLATPIRSDIEKGVQLKTSKRRMATPMKQAIKQGIELKQLKRKMQTPLRRQIQQGRVLKATRRKLATPVRKQIERDVVLRQAAAKKTGLIQKVRMMECLPTIDTIAGTEIVRSESRRRQAKKQADINHRVKLTAVRRMKSTKQCIVQPVFHFFAHSASAVSDVYDIVSPSPKRARTTKTKEGISTLKSPKLDGLQRLMKTPKARQSVLAPEDNFEASVFVTPYATRAKLSSSERTPKTRQSLSVPEDTDEGGLLASHFTRSKINSSTGAAMTKTPNLLNTSQGNRSLGGGSSGVNDISQSAKTPRYILKAVQQSPNLDGVADLMKTPISQVSTLDRKVDSSSKGNLSQVSQSQRSTRLNGNDRLTKSSKIKYSAVPEDAFCPQLFNTPKLNNKSSKSPEEYYNTHLFDMILADGETDMTGFTDLFRSPSPPIALDVSATLETRSTRARKRTACVKLTDNLSGKRRCNATVREPTDVHQMTTRTRSKTASKEIVINLTDEDVKAPALPMTLTLKRQKMTRSVPAGGIADQANELVTRSGRRLKKIQVVQEVPAAEQATKSHTHETTATCSGRWLKNMQIAKVVAVPEQGDELHVQDEATTTRSGRRFKKTQVIKVVPAPKQAHTEDETAVAHSTRRGRQKAVAFVECITDAKSTMSETTATTRVTRSRMRSQAAK